MTSTPIKTYRKATVERRRLYLDYSCWLEDTETLTSFQVTVNPFTEDTPITVNTSYPDADHKRLVMFVGGGAANTNYTLSMVVNTDAGQVKKDDIGLRVTP
jgi:hypothetical protein